MSVIRDNKWRKILEENFPPKFVVKISNGRGYGVFDFDGKGRGFSVESLVDGKTVKQVETLTRGNPNPQPDDPAKEPILVQSGDLGRLNVTEYKSYGDLIPLSTYERYYEDFGGGTHTAPNGFVLVDKDLNVVYKSVKGDRDYSCKIANADEILKIIGKYGPCAMAYLDERLLAKEGFDKKLDIAFTTRKNVLTKLNKTEQIAEEQELFEKMKKLLQAEFEEQKESSVFYSMSIEN